jgi:hypothetical protein
MQSKIFLMGAAALAFASAPASAAPPTTSNGATHSGTPVAGGQPSQDCNTLVADPSGTFTFPGNSTTSPGSAFNEVPGGTAGKNYAGEQTNNTINAATSSQYDVACEKNQSGH